MGVIGVIYMPEQTTQQTLRKRLKWITQIKAHMI